MSTTVLTCDDPLDTLAGAVGADTLITDPAELEYLSRDVFSKGVPLLAAFRPLDKHALARGVAAATSRGIAVVPRGGGMSYIGGYLAPKPGALLIDMSAMNRVLEIDARNMTATHARCSAGPGRDCLNRPVDRRGSPTTLGELSAQSRLLPSSSFTVVGQHSRLPLAGCVVRKDVQCAPCPVVAQRRNVCPQNLYWNRTDQRRGS